MTTGRRGPAPQPASVKKAKGNPGKRPISKMEKIEMEANQAGAGFDDPETASDNAGAMPAITPPEWLSDGGLTVWKQLASRLMMMKVLQHIDALTFGRYCQDFARWIALQDNISSRGETYETTTQHGKFIKLNPASMLASRLNRELMMMEANFGLNPADRQRLFASRADWGQGADLFRKPSVGEGGEKSVGLDSVEKQSAVGFLN